MWELLLITLKSIWTWWKKKKECNQKIECRRCDYSVRKWDLVDNPPRYQFRPNVFCKKDSNEIERQPYDWCGCFIPKPKKLQTKND